MGCNVNFGGAKTFAHNLLNIDCDILVAKFIVLQTFYGQNNLGGVCSKIQQSTKLRSLMQPAGRPRDPIDRLYITILSRYPTDEELGTVSAYFQTVTGNRWPAVVDFAWALINSGEFLYRH